MTRRALLDTSAAANPSETPQIIDRRQEGADWEYGARRGGQHGEFGAHSATASPRCMPEARKPTANGQMSSDRL
jgi:hypothetical protein